MEENSINWWITPAESPDLNPSELLWNKLKHFVLNTVKPPTKDELLNGIAWFWQERLEAEKMFQIHRTFAECAADSCRPLRVVKTVYTVTKTADL